MMRVKLLTILLFFFASGFSSAQINITRYYYNPGVAAVNNIYDHLKPDFTWNMSGPLQAEINAGINALDENNLQLAQLHLSKAISLDSSIWISRYYLGICFKKLGEFERASFEFKQSARLNPKAAEPHIELGEIYIVLQFIKMAEDEFDEAIRRNKELPHGYFGIGNVALLQGLTSKAKRFYEKSNEIDPKFSEGYLIRAIIDIQSKQTDAETLNLLDKTIQVNPTFTQGYFWRGYYYLGKDNPEKCLEDWDKAVQLNPLNPFYIRMRGFLYIELNNYSKAFVDLKNAFKIQNEGLKAQNEEINENKFTGYQTILDKQIDLWGAANYLIATGYGLNEDVLLLLQKGFCLLLAGRNQEALTSVNEAELKQTDSSATVYYIKALILENNNLHKQALQFYTLALGQDKDIFEAHRKRCVYHFEMKDYKSAYNDLNEMFRIQPGSPVAHRFRGLIRAAQGFLGPAIADLNAYIKTDTTDQMVIQARFTCYIVLKKWEESKKDAEWLLKKAGTNWRSYEGFVSEYLSAADTIYAIKICDKFEDVSPQFYWNRVKAAEIVMSQKKWDDAEVRIAKIMSFAKEGNSQILYAKLYYWKGLIARYKYNNPDEALSFFDKSLKLNFNVMEARYGKAELYESIGQRKKALSAYKELSKWGFKDAQLKYEALLQVEK